MFVLLGVDSREGLCLGTIRPTGIRLFFWETIPMSFPLSYQAQKP